MEHAPHTPFAEPSGDACDSYHRWREDIDLVAGAGLNTYRFSLEWSRIEPEEGEFSRAALDHYRRMVDGCRERGLNPIVTLVHFTMPRWLMHDGGWTGPKTGDRFARFAEFAAAGAARRRVRRHDQRAQPDGRPAGAGRHGHARRADPRPAAPRPGRRRRAARRCTAGRREVLRGAGTAQSGMTLIGRENIAEDGGEERMRAERAAFEDQFLAGRRRRRLASACRSTPAPGSVPTAWSPPRRSCRPWRTAWSAGPRRSAPRSAAPPRCCPDVPLLVTENGIATADDEDRIRVHRRRAARPVRRDRRRRRRPRLRALEPARQLRVDARLRAHVRPGRRSTGRPSPGRRSRAWRGWARWPAATAWPDRRGRRSTTCSARWTCRRRCGC